MPVFDSIHILDSNVDMSPYTSSDWVPACTTASDQFNYPYDTYLNVPMSTFHESPSLNPDLAQSRDDFDFYPADPVVEDQHGRTSLYHPNVIDYDNSGLRIKGVDHPPVAHPSPLSTGAPTPSIRSLDPPETPYSTGSLISIAPAQGPFLFSKSPKRSAEDTGAEAGTKRPRRPIAQNPNFELNEEERLLLQLKDEDNLPWKDIAQRFQLKFGRPFNVPALQMRSKRLREKIRVWTETDISALEDAHSYWESHKWDIIASKMLDFGCRERWPVKACRNKWEELHPGMDYLKGPLKTQDDSDRGSPDVSSYHGTPDVERAHSL